MDFIISSLCFSADDTLLLSTESLSVDLSVDVLQNKFIINYKFVNKSWKKNIIYDELKIGCIVNVTCT